MTGTGAQSQSLTLRSVWQRIRRFAAPGLIAIAGLAAVIYLVRQAPALASQIQHIDPWLVLLASILAMAGQFVSFVIWRQIVGAFGVRLPWREHLRCYFFGAVGVAIPGSIWVLAGRSALYSRAGASALRVAVATTFESLLTGISGIVIYAVAVIAAPGVDVWRRPLVGIACAVLAVVLIQPQIFNFLVRWALRRLRQPADLVTADFTGRQLLGWLAVASSIIALGGLVLFILLRSLVPAPAEAWPLVTMAWAAAVSTGNLLFFLPGTFVMRDGAVLVALAPVLPMPVVVLYALVSRVWSMLTVFASAALVWLAFDVVLRRPKAEKDP